MEAEDVKFGAIFFEGKLTLEKLKEFTDGVKDDFLGEEDRVICIAKDFDQELLSLLEGDPKSEFLEEEEEKLYEEYFNGIDNVDILKENKNNQFSIIWIS